MVFKINISTKDGKTYKLESETEALVGKKLHEKLDGKDINNDLEGFEFEITGASDKAGFTAMESVDGTGLKKVLLTYGKGMKKRPRQEGKKKITRNKPKGLRLRKTVRGRVISKDISQINLKVLKDGTKKLSEIFLDQCQPKTKENRKFRRQKPKSEEKPVEETPKEEPKEVASSTQENKSVSDKPHSHEPASEQMPKKENP